MPAYYDGTLFTINFMELASGGEAANLAHNGSINTIYMCDACEGQLPGGGSFVSVIDAIQGDGFNPLWQDGLARVWWTPRTARKCDRRVSWGSGSGSGDRSRPSS